MQTSRSRVAPGIGVVVLMLVAVSASAQGRGNANGKGRHTPAAASAAAGPSSGDGGSASSLASREFGAWLDDATLMDPRHGSLGLSFGHYRSVSSRQIDFPSADISYGWTPRVQFGLAVPYSRVTAVDGSGASGPGDMYLDAKIAIREPAAGGHAAGFAMTPLLEILSSPDPARGGRLFWGLPVSAEMRVDRFRLYGATGYFSRGVVFGSGAVEMPVQQRVVTTGTLTWTRSIADDAGSASADAIGMSRARVDITAAASYVATSSIALFASVGRTISKTDVNSSTLMLNGGVSIAFATPPRTHAPAPPDARPPSRRR
jgi:hypothetical protein